MGHTDRSSAQRRAGSDHQGLAPCGIRRLQRQVAVCGSEGTFINCNAGTSFGGQTCIAYAYSPYACACLNRTQTYGVFIIFRDIALFRRQGNAGTFYRGTGYRYIVQFVQMIYRIRYADSADTACTAAAVQVSVIFF